MLQYSLTTPKVTNRQCQEGADALPSNVLLACDRSTQLPELVSTTSVMPLPGLVLVLLQTAATAMVHVVHAAPITTPKSSPTVYCINNWNVKALALQHHHTLAPLHLCIYVP